MAKLTGRRSVFPGKVDSFEEKFDLKPSQVAQAKRLQELRSKEVLTNVEQEEINSINASLKSATLTPHDMNTFGDAIVNLEQFFNDEVTGYIEDKQAIWNGYINDFKYVGKWVSGKQYKYQNMVTGTNGDLYLARKTHTSTASVTTSNTEFWVKISSKGEKGDTGIAANFRGNWASATAYAINDAVYYRSNSIYGGLLYIAVRANTGKTPSTSPDDWALLNNLFVSETPVTNAIPGTNFIELID